MIYRFCDNIRYYDSLVMSVINYGFYIPIFLFPTQGKKQVSKQTATKFFVPYVIAVNLAIC